MLRAEKGIKEASPNACPILSLFEDIPCHYDGKGCRVSWFCRVPLCWSVAQYFSLRLKNKTLSMMVLRIDHWDKWFERVGRTGFNCQWPGQSAVLKGWRGGDGRESWELPADTWLPHCLCWSQSRYLLPGASLVVRYLVLCLAPLSLSLDVLSLAGASAWTQWLPDFHSLQNVSHHADV